MVVFSFVNEGAGVALEIAEEITIVEQGSRQVQESSNKLNYNAVALSKMAETFMARMKKFKIRCCFYSGNNSG